MKMSVLIFLFVFTACDFPKDPENSFNKAKQDSLKVGVVINPPYVFIENEKVKGSEIDILKGFAKKNNLKIQFIEGSESILIEKLKKYRIHIIAGGFDKKTIWKKYAGTSATYDSNHLFLISKGENKLLQLVETYIFQTIKE